MAARRVKERSINSKGGNRVRNLSTVIVVASALLSGSALAADLSMPYQKSPAAAVFTWTGFYGGAEGIYGFGSGTTADAGPLDVTTKSNGGAFGAYAGYNYQFSSNIVAGVEGHPDYDN